MTDECYCKFLYEGQPFSIASLAGREGERAGGRLAVEDVRDDRLAHRLRSRAGGDCVGGERSCRATRTSNPTSIAQKAAVEALRGPQESVRNMLAEYRKRRDFVVKPAAEDPGRDAARSRRARSTPTRICRARSGAASRTRSHFAERLLAEANVAWCRARHSGHEITFASHTRPRCTNWSAGSTA